MATVDTAIAGSDAVAGEPSAKEIRMVIAASSAGTVFEWYDFFIYGTLASLVGKAFFPSDNETLQMLLVWAGFAVGFGFRPLGAILFGFLGDRLGRKYTFLVTVTLMGIATAGVGLIPTAETIGVAAPLIVLLFRILQGLALGGEYGGATVYVAEHCPPEKRGYYTSFIQAAVVGGFVLSVGVVLACRLLIPGDAFVEWGWRVPFLVSLLLLAISLWMRMKLNESPVFRAMKAENRTSANPFKESFTYPGNKKRIFVALFGITGSLTTIFYAAYFSSLSFLKGPMRVNSTTVEALILVAGPIIMSFYLFVGKWSDRAGRKKPIIWGNALILLTIFPAFWALGAISNPGLIESSSAAPVVVSGPDCAYDPFANTQKTECGKLISDLTAAGVPYTLSASPALELRAGNMPVAIDGFDWEDGTARKAQLEQALGTAGYDFSVQHPGLLRSIGIIGVLLFFGFLSAMNYGSVAALLAEMFPARIRYSSMSIPYHIGAGYFGGFLPVIAGYIVARTGDVYSGLWYTWGFVFIALIVGIWGIPSGPPRDFEENETA
ncbi:MFS transporter [Altererythrobacter sp. CC-YST694]|uniref:MFS transporter n=1 Tax=Altererythrobacter sp. CC-YST694 TaxID=2755038 RepID=UPI001D00DFA6|nr:MFS transporter [Altererythrobacter sp. CC-YST694]MCB5424501.1 MFS transporter [Altererythrobacter sp. CC-YST694]